MEHLSRIAWRSGVDLLFHARGLATRDEEPFYVPAVRARFFHCAISTGWLGVALASGPVARPWDPGSRMSCLITGLIGQDSARPSNNYATRE